MFRSQRLSNFKGDVVYTGIFGDISDELRVRPRQNTAVAFISFLDEQRSKKYRFFNSTRWKVYKPQFRYENLRRQARAHKVLAHKIFKNCRYSLWIDGCLQLTDNNVIGEMEKYLKNTDICVFKHRSRNCVYDELKACIEQQKDDKGIMITQAAKYQEEGYPANNGLAETTALLRRHNKATMEFNEMWWEEICNGSYRDQLSFNYTAWKLGMNYEVFAGNSIRNPYFKWFRH